MSMLDVDNNPEAQEGSFFYEEPPVYGPQMPEISWREQLGLTPDVIANLKDNFVEMKRLRRISQNAGRVCMRVTDEEWTAYKGWASGPRDDDHVNADRFKQIDYVHERRHAFSDMASRVGAIGEKVVHKLTPYLVHGRYKLNGYEYEFVDDSHGGFLAHVELPGVERKPDESPRLVVLGTHWIPTIDRDYRFAQPTDYIAFLRDIIEDKE